MAIIVEWADESKTLIHVTLQGEWNWYDFYAAAGEVVRTMVTVSHRVDVILEMQNVVVSLPKFVTHARRTSFYRRNVGTVVIVQPGGITQRLLHLLRNTLATSPYGETLFAASLDEAHALIRRQRAARDKQPLIPNHAKLP